VRFSAGPPRAEPLPPSTAAVAPSAASFDIDRDVIEPLLALKAARAGTRANLPEAVIAMVAMKARERFLAEPMLLPLEGPVNICGDLHGQYSDLLRAFDLRGYPSADAKQGAYLFLGDYVDRGKLGLETITLLLAYKVKFPGKVFLLRGNHEVASVNRTYGFFDECKRRYNVRLWRVIVDAFNCMPCAAVIDEKIFCCHGGLSPELVSMGQIQRLKRPCDVTDSGLLCDLLWADPDDAVRGWAENAQRQVSYTFGEGALNDFLKRHDFDLLVRAHQVVEDGYQFWFQLRVVSIFGAPNYCGEFDNCAAVMAVDEDLMCSFHILKPKVKKPMFV